MPEKLNKTVALGSITYTPLVIIWGGICGDYEHSSRGKGLKNSAGCVNDIHNRVWLG